MQHNNQTAAHHSPITEAQHGGSTRAADVLDQDAVQTMGQINTKPSGIRDIIAVIDGIAFQTNILALNAAVEAARRRAGRVSAVAARRSRALATRSGRRREKGR